MAQVNLFRRYAWALCIASVIAFALITLNADDDISDECEYDESCYAIIQHPSICQVLTPYSPAWFFFNCHRVELIVVAVQLPGSPVPVFVPFMWEVK